MRRLFFIHLLTICLLFYLAVPNLAGQTQSAQPVKSGQVQHQRQGFFDYALGKINPSNADYGAAMANTRDNLVSNTADDLYFWSNVVTLILFGCAMGVLYFEWRAAAKKEIIAASIIAELWNGRVSDTIEIARRTEQFNHLVEAHNTAVERLLAAASKPSEQERESVGSLSKNIRQLAETNTAATKRTPQETQTAPAGAPSSTDAGTLRLQQNNLLLQRRVEALENSERNLKQRLNQTVLLLDEERRRNSTLKGA
jgi:hypothetical protein